MPKEPSTKTSKTIKPAPKHAPVIGIDLGTTNSALAYCLNSKDRDSSVQLLPIPQLVEKNLLGSEDLLSSVIYIPTEDETTKSEPPSPFVSDTSVVGRWAKTRGALVPDRLVSSAKSWLTHLRVDRSSKILPWQSPLPAADKVSPVEASSRYLKHLRQAFLLAQPEQDEPETILTVPASFDEMARNLTLQAAGSAGFSKVTLLEEPLAAFYAWLDQHGKDWRTQISTGDLILVCDIGGGTTDFSLIYASEDQDDARKGQLNLERISVGEHLLLGGDNMDLALANHVRQKLLAEGHEIGHWQYQSLVSSCRDAKEALFTSQATAGAPPITEVPISLTGRGSSLFKQTLTSSLSLAEAEKILLEGFFPKTSHQDLPQRRRSVGIQELGLTYETDPVLSRHLARFLARSQENARKIPHIADLVDANAPILVPSSILFNGGVFKSTAFQQRIVDLLSDWAAALKIGTDRKIKVLTAADLDTAVARGAAYYGRLRATGKGIRVQAGTARSFYIGLDSPAPAVPGIQPKVRGLCLVSQGTNEGTRTLLADQEFGLLVGETVDFRFFSSNVRPEDRPGALIDDAGSLLEESSQLQVTLTPQGYQDGELIPVKLEAFVSEMGTLQVALNDLGSRHSWKLEFDVRDSL